MDVLRSGESHTMSRSRDHGASETIPLTEQNFDQALVAKERLMMLDFWAEWSGPAGRSRRSSRTRYGSSHEESIADIVWTTGTILTVDGGIVAQ